jgi:hypothetical protein
MDRHLVAYLLLAAALIAVLILVVRARYYSRDNVLKRGRLADQARARRRRDESDSAD